LEVEQGWQQQSRRPHRRDRATEEIVRMTVQQIELVEPTTEASLGLTEHAAVKVRALLDQEGRDDLRLRVAVQPGGCSGMQYQLFFDERTLDGDLELALSGVPVVVDRMSAPYLGGATIDFTDTIEQQGFTIDNPNASGGCACGNSFCG
jgi:iron-sulfur cluster assembly accessory protein